MTLYHVYYWVRIITWYIDFFTFVVLFYKYVSNNWTGKKHELNWGACGMWAGTLAYIVSTGEILYKHDQQGGIRVFAFSAIVLFWCYIALFKIKLIKELDPEYFGTEENNADF